MNLWMFSADSREFYDIFHFSAILAADDENNFPWKSRKTEVITFTLWFAQLCVSDIKN